MTARITVVDFGVGNLHTVRRKLERIGADTIVSSDPADILAAEKLVLPGVGHFRGAMDNLESLGLRDALHEAAKVRGIPILGICLGMQLMARHSHEGDAQGLGWIDADVVRFSVDDTRRFKVPHIGWNGVAMVKESPLTRGLPDDAEFYFVHAFHMAPRDPGDTLCETEYAYRFASAVQRDNLFGVQFHPEKSHASGDILLRNFTAL